MGSYAYLRVGDLVVHSTKHSIDATVMMLFTEDDKRVYEDRMPEDWVESWANSGELDEQLEPDPEESYLAIEYAADPAVVRDRLEFMGFTMPAVRKLFLAGIEAHLEYLRNDRTESAGWDHSGTLERWRRREIELLSGLTLEDWLAAVRQIIEGGHRPDSALWHRDQEDASDLPPLVCYILGAEWGQSLWFPTDDVRPFVRALLDAMTADAKVVYDLAELSGAEELDVDEDLCDWALRQTADEFVLNAKVIVLTEGGTDQKSIQGALRVLYPHLAGHYSFMDFEGARPPGGAGQLAATLKAFIGAGIVNRVVALFDNDTAARDAVRQLGKRKLPPNVRVLHYPDLEFARDYPTLGPQGLTHMDVNGLAGSVELYFGLDVLRQPDGKLTPVQWLGFNNGLHQYQGELMDKAALQCRYAEKLKVCTEDPAAIGRYDWSGMRSILDAIRTAFHGL